MSSSSSSVRLSATSTNSSAGRQGYYHHDEGSKYNDLQRNQYTDATALSAPYDSNPSPASSVPSSSASLSSVPLRRSNSRESLQSRALRIGEKCLDYFVKIIGPLLSITAVCLITYVTYVYFVEVLPLLNARICHGTSDDALRRYTARGDWVKSTFKGRDGIYDQRSGRFIPDPDRLEQMQAQSAALESGLNLDGCASTSFVTCFGVYLLFSILFHYFSCMLKGPGRPPKAPFGQEVLDHLSHYDPERREDQAIRFCKPCGQVKPMRAHHCRVCGHCCLKMDHRQDIPDATPQHIGSAYSFQGATLNVGSRSVGCDITKLAYSDCPWVNTCVGWRNHRHFISFLFYLWSGCGFFLLASFDSAMSVLVGDSGGGTSFLIACVITVAAFIAGSLFLGWSAYLLLTNQTTIEFYGNWATKTNPYNIGVNRNIAAVFGEMGLWILALPSLIDPPGEGIIFPLNAGRGMPLPMLINERTA